MTGMLVIISSHKFPCTNLHDLPCRWRAGRGYGQSGQRHPVGPRERMMGGYQLDRHGPRGQGNNNMNAANSWGGPGGLPHEQHLPVRGFNAAESKEALKKGISHLDDMNWVLLLTSVTGCQPTGVGGMIFFCVDNSMLKRSSLLR